MPPYVTTEYMDEQLLIDAISPPPAPQAEYHFDEGSGTTTFDHSPNHYDGTLGGTLGAGFRPTWVGNTLHFAPNQVVSVPPAAYNGAGTIIAVCAPTLGVQTDMQAVLSGSQIAGGTISHGFAPGDGRPFVDASDLYGQVMYGSGQPLISLSGAVAWRLDGSTFVRGQKTPWNATPSHGYPPPDPINTSNANIGLFAFGGNAPLTGFMYALAMYSQQLTDTDVAAESARLEALASARGVTLSSSTAITHPLLVFVGDSMTRGYLAGLPHLAYPQKTLTLLGGTYNYLNLAIGGDGSADVNLHLASQIFPVLATYPGTKVLINMSGTNNNWNTTVADYTACYVASKAAGFTYMIGVQGLPRFADDTPRAAFNTALAGGVGTMCDAVALWANSSVMGQAGQYSSGTYYADGLHPTAAGHAIGAGYLQTALASLGLT